MGADQRVLVIGGTRGTGYLIVNLLPRDGYRVRTLARKGADAKEKLGPAVEIVEGDITKLESLPGAMQDVDHIIFTAGVTQRPADEPLVRATNYEGVKNTLAAARDAGFNGRFLYMTTLGVTKSSPAATLLNLVIRNTTKRRSGLDYTVIRAGILTNSPGGQRAIEVSQDDYPLAFNYRISRADVAEVFVQALKHPITRRTTFDVVWARGSQRKGWDTLFGQLKPDA